MLGVAPVQVPTPLIPTPSLWPPETPDPSPNAREHALAITPNQHTDLIIIKYINYRKKKSKKRRVT